MIKERESLKSSRSFNKKVLSIDFGSSEIKIIEGQASKKGPNILKAFSVCLPKDAYYNGKILNSEIISELIETALKENKVSTNQAYCTINSSDIITREVTIPSVAKNEISSILSFQLDNFLPVDPDDYVVQHLLVDTIMEDEVQKLNILLIAIPKTMVLGHLELLKDAGLKPQILDYQGNTIAKMINFNDKINDNYNTANITIGSLDLGYDSSKLTITKNGKIEVTRILDTGAKSLYENIGAVFDCSIEESEEKVKGIENINPSNEEFTDYYRIVNITNSTIHSLMEKVEMIFRYYRTRHMGNDVNLIILQGGLSNINGVDNIFSNHFNIPSVNLKKLDKLKWDGDLSKYSNAIGGLIRISEV